MFSGLEYYLDVGASLLVGFVVVLSLFQFSSAKKQFSQMTTIDLITNFLLGGILGGFIYNEDISYIGFFIIIIVYFIIIFIINHINNRTR